MSATNVACQRRHNCVHVVADRAVYAADGTVTGFRNKIHTVGWGAITGRGNSALLDWLSEHIGNWFGSFDDCVAGIEEGFGDLLYMAPVPAEEKRSLELIIAGLSESRSGPESYVVHATDELPPGGADALDRQRELGVECVVPCGGRLTKLPPFVAGPVCTPDMVLAAGYSGIDLDGDPADVIATLHLIIEMQRHDAAAMAGQYLIGGGADLVTISPDGIFRSTLACWPEDEVGQKINPQPINWPEWRAANLAKPRGLAC